MQCDALARAERRLFRRRYRTAESARRLEAESLASPERRRDHVRQRRQFGAAARRARRPAARRHPEVRARAGAQRARGAARAAGAAADARARAARRPHRRQPAAVDDAALQRRFSRRDRRAARAPRLPRPRLAGDACSRRRSAPSTATAPRRAAKSKSTPGRSSGQFVRRIWLEPPVSIHPAVAKAIAEFDAAIIGPGSFYTSLMPIFLVSGVPEALAEVKGPVILIANLLTEGRGMIGFTAADAVDAHRGGHSAGTSTSSSPTRSGRRRRCSAGTRSSTRSRSRRASCRDHCELVGGEFWTGDIARHDRLRLAYAVWSVLSRRVLQI